MLWKDGSPKNEYVGCVIILLMFFHHFMAKYLYVQYIVSIAALDSNYIFQYCFVVNISFKTHQHSIKYDGQLKWISCQGNFSKKIIQTFA